MANRFDSYMRGAKLARILADEAWLELKRGNDRKALGHLIASVRQFITATNNISHLKFNPRKKNPWTKKQAKKLYPAPLLHVNGDFPSDKRDTGGGL